MENWYLPYFIWLSQKLLLSSEIRFTFEADEKSKVQINAQPT